MSWTAPWLLAGLAFLPLLWWLMRLLPPSPRAQIFPALLLLGSSAQSSAQQRLPWWLIILRLLLAACLILGLAGPVWRKATTQQPALRQTLIIDNGWTAATRFEDIRKLALRAIDDHSSATSLLRIMPSASDNRSAPDWMSPAMAKQQIQKLEPMPWAGNRVAVTKWPATGDTLLVSDGLDQSSASKVIAWGQKSGRVRIIEAARLPPVQITSVKQDAAGLAVTLAQAPIAQMRSYTLSARNSDGSTAAIGTGTIAANQTTTRLLLPLAPGAGVRLSHVEVNGEASSAAVHLLDSRAARIYVGISNSESDTPQPLRSADFYVDRALQTHADVTRGNSAALLARGVNILMIPDRLPQQPVEQAKLSGWVEQGGVLILFAGPRSQPTNNSLLPVPIRAATRSLSGAMSWGKAASLGPWPAASPFSGLPIPSDVSVQQQWLAEPGLAKQSQSWAQLADATPLVSAQNRGRGLIVLFHTSANADWSNLALSGLFEQMLLRLLPFAASLESASTVQNDTRFALKQSLTGSGQVQPPTKETMIAYEKLAQARQASADLPPGRYAATGKQFVLNVGGAMPDWISNYRGAQLQNSAANRLAFDARAPLLTLAAILLLLDGLATLTLKGLWRKPRLPAFAALFCALFISLPHSIAEAAPERFDVRLCAVRGVADADALAGLQIVAQSLKMRTAIVPGEPRLVSLQDKNLGLCTLLYWPIGTASAPLDGVTTPALQRYMARGGFLFIDSGWSNAPIRNILDPLALPQLELFTPKHVLAKSFYLLERAPGGFDFSTLWLESGTQGNDGRTTQVILSNGRIASQWRGEGQAQERALRLGINAVIYALTGTYKADQVHAAGLLERMARQTK
jgi:hypothetical protein